MSRSENELSESEETGVVVICDNIPDPSEASWGLGSPGSATTHIAPHADSASITENTHAESAIRKRVAFL